MSPIPQGDQTAAHHKPRRSTLKKQFRNTNCDMNGVEVVYMVDKNVFLYIQKACIFSKTEKR